MYKLFTDKNELFECSIKLQGASLKKSKARLVVETQEYSLLFNGTISNSGKCEIPIKKLKLRSLTLVSTPCLSFFTEQSYRTKLAFQQSHWAILRFISWENILI